eukprot:180296_1
MAQLQQLKRCPLCCGKLVAATPSTIYSNDIVCTCDHCNQTVNMNDVVYHCELGEIYEHSKGYDLCKYCIDGVPEYYVQIEEKTQKSVHNQHPPVTVVGGYSHEKVWRLADIPVI